MSDLPGDLLEEILCRVPATSLKPLRFTCKRWNHLINDDIFSKKHLDKAAKQFLVLDLKEFRVCSISVNLHGTPSIDVICKLNPNDSNSNSAHINIDQVSCCNGMLLCTIKDDDTRIVVWNPCTGQTKWIQTGNCYKSRGWNYIYTLGSYQDNNSYKVLRSSGYLDPEYEVCDINSNSWRTIDAPDCRLSKHQNVSLKGKTYWFGLDGNEEQHYVFLVSFDYTRERFERLSLHPCQFDMRQFDPCHFPNGFWPNMALSVVREEKLSMLLQRPHTLRNEVWVTDKIDETMSWIKILTVDDHPDRDCSFINKYYMVDEEKKSVLLCCEKFKGYNTDISKYIYNVGDNNQVVMTEVDFGGPGYWPRLQDYVPSLTHIH